MRSKAEKGNRPAVFQWWGGAGLIDLTTILSNSHRTVRALNIGLDDEGKSLSYFKRAS